VALKADFVLHGWNIRRPRVYWVLVVTREMHRDVAAVQPSTIDHTLGELVPGRGIRMALHARDFAVRGRVPFVGAQLNLVTGPAQPRNCSDKVEQYGEGEDAENDAHGAADNQPALGSTRSTVRRRRRFLDVGAVLG
jgi:hypothetical protein